MLSCVRDIVLKGTRETYSIICIHSKPHIYISPGKKELEKNSWKREPEYQNLICIHNLIFFSTSSIYFSILMTTSIEVRPNDA